MYTDPEGKAILTLLIAALIGGALAAISSTIIQAATNGGEVDWRQVGISAAFGAVGGALSVTGVLGTIGQFVIQGALGLGETYSIAALNGTVSSIGVEECIATFLFSGAIGAIGAKGANTEFKRACQIEGSFIKYTKRDVTRYGTSLVKTILSRGRKYIKDFIKPIVVNDFGSYGVSTVANIASYYLQKVYDYMR
jgi:hypothetical protein